MIFDKKEGKGTSDHVLEKKQHFLREKKAHFFIFKEKRVHFYHFQEARFFHATFMLMHETPKIGPVNV